jgi:hydroxymethylpyrimidine kinase/phosphomethylpyrimidine kinase
VRTVLTIAGSDPTGGAGLQADLQVFRARGVHGTGVVTALTVQDTKRVHHSLPVFPNVVLDQLRILLRDIQPAAVKLGMLGTDDIVRNVMLGLGELDPAVPVVLDPVLAASDGTPLLERRAWGSLGALIERAALVTPNLSEAEALTGIDTSSDAGCERAARELVERFGADAALIKGGHRAGAPNDLLALRAGSELELHWLAGERIDAGAVHGTGCALSAAIAAELACGASLRDAVLTAREFVAEGLRNAHAPGSGARLLGFA